MCVAAAVAGAGLAGSVISASGAQSAADTQAASANNATQAQLGMFNTVQQNLGPYQQGGSNALAALQNFLGEGPAPGTPQSNNLTALGITPFSYDPNSDPLYNFMLKQGSNAITSQASALGGVNSGATLKALSDYGQNTALSSYQTEYNNWQNNLNNIFNRLYNTAGLGENAAAGVGNAAISTGQSIGNNMIGAGNAQAAGTVGATNALNGGLMSILNNPAFLNSFNNSGGAGNFSAYNTPAMSTDPYLTGGM